MEHEVEGSRPRGRPNKTWKEVIHEDCQACKLNKEDAMDRCRWRKMIKEARWSGWVWVGECFFWHRPTRVVPDQRPLNGRCCCNASVCTYVQCHVCLGRHILWPACSNTVFMFWHLICFLCELCHVANCCQGTRIIKLADGKELSEGNCSCYYTGTATACVEHHQRYWVLLSEFHYLCHF